MIMADADEPEFVSAIRDAMLDPRFAFSGNDQYKRMETVACLWTMHKKLRQGGTFLEGQYTADSDEFEDNPLALSVNQPDDDHTGARAIDIDQADRSINRWFRCDENSKRILGFDHQLLQHSSFQTADTSDKYNVKSFDLGPLQCSGRAFETEMVNKLNALRIRRGILFDSVVGFLHIVFNQSHCHFEDHNDQLTKNKERRGFFGGTMASFALRMNGNNLHDDLEQDVNWAVEDLSEIVTLVYVVGNRIALVSWDVLRRSWLVTGDIKNVVLMNFKCDEFSDMLDVIKSVQVSPLCPEHQITNSLFARGLSATLPTDTAFQFNSARWKEILMRLPGPIEQATLKTFDSIISSILDGGWQDDPRQQIIREGALYIRARLKPESFAFLRPVFSKILFDAFKNSEFTAASVDVAAYHEVHDSSAIQQALDRRHAEQTKSHHQHLRALFECVNTKFFIDKFKINDAFLKLIRGVCHGNPDTKISEVFEHYFLVCRNARDSKLSQVTQLDFSPAAGFYLTQDCPAWNQPASEVIYISLFRHFQRICILICLSSDTNMTLQRLCEPCIAAPCR